MATDSSITRRSIMRAAPAAAVVAALPTVAFVVGPDAMIAAIERRKATDEAMDQCRIHEDDYLVALEVEQNLLKNLSPTSAEGALAALNFAIANLREELTPGEYPDDHLTVKLLQDAADFFGRRAA